MDPATALDPMPWIYATLCIHYVTRLAVLSGDAPLARSSCHRRGCIRTDRGDLPRREWLRGPDTDKGVPARHHVLRGRRHLEPVPGYRGAGGALEHPVAGRAGVAGCRAGHRCPPGTRPGSVPGVGTPARLGGG